MVTVNHFHVVLKPCHPPLTLLVLLLPVSAVVLLRLYLCVGWEPEGRKSFFVNKSHRWCRQQDLQGLITLIHDMQTTRIINNVEDRATVESKMSCLGVFATQEKKSHLVPSFDDLSVTDDLHSHCWVFQLPGKKNLIMGGSSHVNLNKGLYTQAQVPKL